MAFTDETEVRQDDVETVPAVPPPEHVESKRELFKITPGGVFRVIVLVGIIAFLGIYVGPATMGKTLFKVAVAVALSGVVFVGANKLFDQAYPKWTRFNTFIGVVVGFVLYIVLECNGAFRSLFDDRVKILGGGPWDVNPWLWGGIGALAGGVVMFLLSAPRATLARLPLAVIGVGGFGALTTYAFEESVRPALDWNKVWICAIVGAALFGAVTLIRKGPTAATRSALTGAGVGWLVGAWGGGDIGRGNLTGVAIATIVPAVVLGVRFGLASEPNPAERRRIDSKSRSWIFLVPALALTAGGLVIPLIKTTYQSFRNRNGSETVGMQNYRDIFGDPNAFNIDNWDGFLTSRLFYAAIAIAVAGVVIGIVSGRRTRQAFDRTESSTIPLFIAFFLLACAVLSTSRGTIFNNIWWVVVVTSLATAIGLGTAVLADRAKGEQVAKALIFLPMAISFVGAGIIWRFMYIARPPTNNQTGVMNSIWVYLGQISNGQARWLGLDAKWVAVAVLAAAAVGLLLLVARSIRLRASSTAGISLGIALILAYLIFRLVGPGLGGFVKADGTATPDTIIFFQDTPFNNLWLMVILIWIQTGFAMVILSSAIKAVPTELTEAARIDGASQTQIFWRVTVPQIGPTIGVVVTTLIVTVMKVFDIVKVSTNGQSDTEVIANQMFTSAFGNSNEGLGAALAVVLFISIIPVMYVNIRRIQQNRA